MLKVKSFQIALIAGAEECEIALHYLFLQDKCRITCNVFINVVFIYVSHACLEVQDLLLYRICIYAWDTG